MDKYLILDGNYLLHRVLHAAFSKELSTDGGDITGGCFGALRIVRNAVMQFKPTKCLYVWDKGISKRRRILYPDYKHKRVVDEKEHNEYMRIFYSQVRLLEELLGYINVHSISVGGKEGDDVCYQLSRILDGESIVVSDDRDYILMLKEGTDIFRPMANEYVTLANCKKVTGYTPGEYLFRKVIEGDSSDNIKGVRGAGKKTIDGILEQVTGIDTGSANREVLSCILDKLKELELDRRGKLILENLHIVERNLWMVDCSFEEWSTGELIGLGAQVQEKLEYNEKMFIKRITELQFKSMLKGYSLWSLPFKRLK